jgi:hypothetical protein
MLTAAALFAVGTMLGWLADVTDAQERRPNLRSLQANWPSAPYSAALCRFVDKRPGR